MIKLVFAFALATLLALPALAQTPTPAEAKAFIERSEQELLQLANDAQQAAWVQSTYITYDTQEIAAKANQILTDAGVRIAKQAAQYRDVPLDPVNARKLALLRNSLVLAAPSNPQQSAELARLASNLEATYGRGKVCKDDPQSPTDKKCLSIIDIEKIMANSRDAAELRAAWEGWHQVSPPMKKEYARLVDIANQGARELGYPDTGAMWRSKYDMPPDAFAKELDRLWEQVKPLYLSLHTYVRRRLREQYGAHVVPAHGPIPAYLLGNIWAQSWENIYPLVAPPNEGPALDVTELLKARNVNELGMVRFGEGFFTSLGFDKLPPTFWERSLFLKPADRDVVCHASAWDVDSVNDLRIKMCIQRTGEDFVVIHHELGHNFYQRAYNQQPPLFRDSANDGFHEAIGDTIALSVTPEYLVKVGLLDKPTDQKADIGLLLHKALEKVAFLPFGLLIDQWRWKVFSGEVTPANYNASWWQLRTKYQGIAPPQTRGEDNFDAGAKYHVPAQVPYSRYFLAAVLQFQFHRALAKEAGCTLPLHRCSIYANDAAGKKLTKMLELGASKPWPDALYEVTGQRQMDATAMLEYFAPLKKWLDEQNAGQPTGW